MIKFDVKMMFFTGVLVGQLHGMDVNEIVQASKLGAWKAGKSLVHLCLAIVVKQLREHNYSHAMRVIMESGGSKEHEKISTLVANQLSWINELSKKYYFDIDITKLQELVHTGIDVDMPGEYSSSELSWLGFNYQDVLIHYAVEIASRQEEWNFAKNLLLAGANPNKYFRNVSYDCSMLHSVISEEKCEKQTELVALLLKAGADVTHVLPGLDRQSPLKYAIYAEYNKKDKPIIRLLLAAGAPINIPNGHGETDEQMAADWGVSLKKILEELDQERERHTDIWR